MKQQKGSMSGFYGDLLDVVHEFMVDVGIFCVLSDPNADKYKHTLHASLETQFKCMNTIFKNCPCKDETWPLPLMMDVTDCSENAFIQALDNSWPPINRKCLKRGNRKQFFFIPIVWKWLENGGERSALVIVNDGVQWYYDPAWSEKEEGTPAGKIRCYMSQNSLLQDPVLKPRLVDGCVQSGDTHVNLETAIIAACNNPNVTVGIHPPSTLPCLIFAVLLLRCGFTDPNTIARTLTIWFMSPGGPRASIAGLVSSGSVICRTPIRLLSWEANLMVAIQEKNIQNVLQLLGLKVPLNRTTLRPCSFVLSSGKMYTRLCDRLVANESALCQKCGAQILQEKYIEALASGLRPGLVARGSMVYRYKEN